MIKPYDIVVIMLIAGLELVAHLPQNSPLPGKRLVECKQNLKDIGITLDMYASDHQEKYPPSLAELVPLYRKEVPQCPWGGTYVYYKGKSAPQNEEGLEHYYYVECHGYNHSETYQKENLPAYSSTSGLITD